MAGLEASVAMHACRVEASTAYDPSLGLEVPAELLKSITTDLYDGLYTTITFRFPFLALWGFCPR